MTAEEMFEDIGYCKYGSDKEIIFAKNKGDEEIKTLTFTKSCMNTPLILLKHPILDYEIVFDVDMIKAITEQIKELGWDK